MYVTKILVVDDDLSARTLVKSFLGREGYKLIEAADGRSAWELAVTERPDLYLVRCVDAGDVSL